MSMMSEGLSDIITLFFDIINLLTCLKIATVDIIKALLWLHKLFELD